MARPDAYLHIATMSITSDVRITYEKTVKARVYLLDPKFNKSL